MSMGLNWAKRISRVFVGGRKNMSATNKQTGRNSQLPYIYSKKKSWVFIYSGVANSVAFDQFF